MMRKQKKRDSGYAAWLLLPAVLGGLYFGARMIAEAQITEALRSASDLETAVRAGLWNYNFLTAREQLLYDSLIAAMETRDEKTQRVTFVPTQAEFSAAFDAVLCDYPLYCDLIREECMLIAGENSAFMELSYLEDGEERRRAISDFAQSIVQEGRGASLSESVFALMLNDSLTRHCRYASELSDQYSTAYDAITGTTDSFGYALLYTLVCREVGIDCAVVRGTVTAVDTVGVHAWNVLTLDGVTGYTDVMWNDSEMQDAEQLPFHGYYFLSAEEIGADHTMMAGLSFPIEHETENYYEQIGVCVTDADTMHSLLPSLLTDARAHDADAVEFMLDPAFEITDYALEEALTAAIEAANAAEGITGPHLRGVHRLYRSSANGRGITVQLFYEDNNNELGES